MGKRARGFGELLRQLRQAAGLTQARLAEEIGVSTAYISALENGRKPPPPRAVVQALARCLGVGEEELWERARREREARFRQKVQGRSVALRFLSPVDLLAEKDTAQTEEKALGSCVREFLAVLEELLPDPRRRCEFIRSLTRALRNLKGQGLV